MDPGFVAGAAELCGRQGRGEVEQGARDGGDRDVVERRGVQVVELRSVDGDARALPAGGDGDRDLGRRRRSADEPQQVGVGAVAQERALAAGEHGGHVVAADRWRGVAESVDAAVDAAQPPVMQPALDAVAVDAGFVELLDRDPAVLAIRDPGEVEG